MRQPIDGMTLVLRALRIGLLLCVGLGLAGCAINPDTTAAKGGQSGDLVTDSDEPDSRKRARIRLELAVGYFEEGQTTVALDELKLALAADPNFAEAFNLRGLIYMRLNDVRLAEESFRRALALSPGDANVLHNHGWLMCQQGRFAEATQMFTQALGNPQYGDRPKTLMTQGLCQIRAGQRADAEASLLRSYELDAGNPITGFNLASLLFQRGEFARAQFYIRRINNSDLANAESLWLGIKVERRMNNQDGADQLATQMRRRFGQSREAALMDRERSMTELAGDRAAVSTAPVAPAQASAGARLRQARENAGVHIGALAVALKVPVRKLEALEADRHDLLPDAVFVRALAASVCKTLKTDPLPVLELLPGYVAPRLALSHPDGHGSFSTPRDGWQVPLLSRLSKPVAAIVGILLLATVVLWFWPVTADGPQARKVATKTEAPAGTPAAVVPVLAPVPAASTAQVAAPVAAASAPALAAVVARELLVPAGTAAGAVLSIRAKSASWVEVVDATGGVQLRKVLNSGDLVTAGGAMPLSVVVGRTDATEVQVRGQAFDLAPHTRDNVARFQVK